jgi:hypothetical protein
VIAGTSAFRPNRFFTSSRRSSVHETPCFSLDDADQAIIDKYVSALHVVRSVINQSDDANLKAKYTETGGIRYLQGLATRNCY